MALPTFVAAGTAATGIGDITPALPPGYAADDIHLLLVQSRPTDSAPAAPTGYGEVTSSPKATAASTRDSRLSVFWKRSTASESAPTVVDVGDHLYGRILAFRGCLASGNPWNITSGNTDANLTTAVSITGATTTLPDCLVVLVTTHGEDSAPAWLGAVTNADLATLTERADAGTTDGIGGGIAVVTGQKATAGAYATSTATATISHRQANMTIALAPALAADSVGFIPI